MEEPFATVNAPDEMAIGTQAKQHGAEYPY